jgi:hypothetical protein
MARSAIEVIEIASRVVRIGEKLGENGTSFRNRMRFWIQPFVEGQVPVNREERLGLQIGWLT